MTFWWWVLVFGGIAVVAVVLFSLLGLRAWRKAKVLLAELARLSTVAESLEMTIDAAGRPTAPEWVPAPIAIGRHRSE